MHAKKKKTSAHESAKYDVVYNDKRFLNILALNTAPVADALRVELSRKIDASMEERGRLKAFVYELDENDLPKRTRMIVKMCVNGYSSCFLKK